MREFDTFNAVTGGISALGAVVSIVYMLTQRRLELFGAVPGRPIPLSTFFPFLLACSGWSLLVLSYVWIFEPYGPYLTDRKQLQLIGIIVVFPAIIVLWAGVRYLLGRET